MLRKLGETLSIDPRTASLLSRLADRCQKSIKVWKQGSWLNDDGRAGESISGFYDRFKSSIMIGGGDLPIGSHIFQK